MPVQTINTINDKLIEDPKFKEYILQSLANLGQRLGVKGDSVATKSFAFKDLFDIDSRVSNETHVGLVERRNGEITISIKDMKTLTSSPAQELLVPVSNDSISISTAFELTTPINGVASYANGGIITVDNIHNRYILTFIGKNEQGEFVEFICDEFDKTNNQLLKGLRICNLSNRTTAVKVSKESRQYKIDIYDLVDDNNENIDLEQLLTNIHDFLLGLNGKNVNIKTYDVEYWLSVKPIYLIYPETVIIEINDLTTTDSLKINLPPRPTADSTLEERENYEYLSNLLDKYPTINTVLGYFIYDNAVFYPYAKQYYSESVYVSNDLDFKEQIIISLFNTIYNNVVRNNKLYIPVDYVFEYYCNANNEWQIYGSVSDITVRYVNVPINIYNLPLYYNGSSFVANIVGDNQVAIFDYAIEYDNNDSEIVSNISVEKKYTLPYINSNNVWVVDGLVTDVLAKGRDAGNPNIVIVYNENKNNLNPQIICGANKESVLNKLSWEEKSVYIQPLEQINVDDPKIVTESDLYILSCKVPTVKQYTSEEDIEKYITPLRYALIVNMSSINCLDLVNPNDENDPIVARYGRYGVITTLWMLNEKTNEFECVQNPYFENDIRNVALDINSLTNLNNIIKWHIKNAELKHPDRYRHKWLVFENALTSLKNNVNDFQSYVYPVIMNEKSIDIAEADYNNDFNMIIKYQDLVRDAEADEIFSVGTSHAQRYITEDKFTVSNALYSYYPNNKITDGKRQLYSEFVPKENIPTLNLKEILVQNQTLENRSNIVSFNRAGEMYYSYIGTSFDDEDKNKTRIGSVTKNINLGSETMIHENDELFKKSTELHFDFNNNYLNGYAYVQEDLNARNDINVEHLLWTEKNIDNHKLHYTNYVPSSTMLISEPYRFTKGTEVIEFVCTPLQFNNTYMYNGVNGNATIIENQILNYYLATDLKKQGVSDANRKLWVPCFYYLNQEIIGKSKFLYLGDALYLPNLLTHLRLYEFTSTSGLSNVDLTSNCEIISYKNIPLMLMTCNRFISGVQINNPHDIDGISFPHENSRIYTGNSLDITYYLSGNRLKITINETTDRCKIQNLFKIQTKY